MKFKLWIGLVLGSLLLAACGGTTAESNTDFSQRPIRVVTTTGQIGDVAQNIGGNHADVTPLMGAGVDPHLYVATESDVSRLAEADVIFYNGLFLEARMDDVLEQLGEQGRAVPIGENVPTDQLLGSVAYANEHDPHIWFDVQLWSQAAEAIRDKFIEMDPAHAEDYQANADAYLADLADLDRYVREQAARVPEGQRVLVTAHDAFRYFGRAYGFEVRGLQGISTESEAGTGDVQELADFIATNQIPALFVESSVPVRNIEALQAAVQSQGFNVEIGGQLFSDAMGDPGTPEGTYIGMVRHNIDTIVSALLGES